MRTALRNFSIGMFFALICILFIHTSANGQEAPLTGDSPPVLTVLPADDKLLALETTIELAEFRAEEAKLNLKEISEQPILTAADRAERLEETQKARRLYYLAKAGEHRAKHDWCTYYAKMVGEVPDNIRVSAVLHRRQAQRWEQRAVALLDVERPSVEYSGRHRPDMTRYGD